MNDTPNAALDALGISAQRLRAIVDGLGPSALEARAYPTEWTVADVLSHIGSGAVIVQHWFDDAAAGRPTSSGFEQAIWDEWGAKPATARAGDALAADRVLIDRLTALGPDERARFRFVMGPIDTDYDGFVGIRLNEHALHTWDIEVTVDPAATVPSDTAAVILGNLELITRYTGNPTGTAHRVAVRTTDPERDLVVAYSADAVALEPGTAGATPDIELPAEAFVRLVYGRLDPAHAPVTDAPAVLEGLRATFPGP